MKILALFAVLATGALLIYAERDFPAWGDPASPASTHLSPHYITQSLRETAVPNFVTSLLADYRGYDTMYETAVIFSAGIAVFMMLRLTRRRKGERAKDRADSPAEAPDNLIVRNACRLMIPPLQLFSLYVIAHGHHSPGGGFQGGVMLGASLILLALAYDLRAAMEKLSEKRIVMLAGLGVLIYAGIGAGSMVLGGNFLDYSVWSAVLPATDTVMARSHGMLGVEVGVALTVMAIMFSLYVDLASHGRLDQGL